MIGMIFQDYQFFSIQTWSFRFIFPINLQEEKKSQFREWFETFLMINIFAQVTNKQVTIKNKLQMKQSSTSAGNCSPVYTCPRGKQDQQMSIRLGGILRIEE